MTKDLIAEDERPEALLLATEAFYREIAHDLAIAVQKLSAGVDVAVEAKLATQAIKDMRAVFLAMMEERTRVEKLRKQIAGVTGDTGDTGGTGETGGGHDFDAARDEIGRRLACLRDAGGGG